MFFCVWNLVQDDDCDVREYAAIFIAKLSQEFDQVFSIFEQQEKCDICLLGMFLENEFKYYGINIQIHELYWIICNLIKIRSFDPLP